MRDTLRAIGQLTALGWNTDRRRLLGAFALMLAETMAMPLGALALAELTDAAVAGDVTGASRAGVIVAVLAIAALTGQHFAHILYFELGALAFLRLDRELIDLSNGSAGLEHHERAEYSDRVAVLRQEIARLYYSGMTVLLNAASLAAGMGITAVLLLRLNPWLLLLPLAALPPLLMGRRAEAVTGAARRAAAPHTRAAQHMLDLAKDAASAKELRVLGLRRQITDRHAAHWATATRGLWAGEIRAALWRAGGQLFFALAYIGGTLLVVRDVLAHEGSVGDVVLAITLAAQVNQQVTATVTLLQELQRLAETLADLRWIRELADRQQPPPADAEIPAALRDGIRLRDVSFHYPGTEAAVLRGVDLHLPAGSTVAIVGENGAGKSTLVKLLCRFYEPTSGTIEVDGADLRRLDLDAWRQRISAGFQDFSRFELPAGQTVGIGDLPRAGDARAIAAALDRAQAGDLLRRLPQGLATPLGYTLPGGVELSGGQWQKLALGRAMMREEPLLLVLDEPTSALDAQAEHLLFERWAHNAREVARRTGAVTLLVSHRFSTVRMADLILVVEDSAVTEAGGHEELMAADGLYAELYRLQARQYG